MENLTKKEKKFRDDIFRRYYRATEIVYRQVARIEPKLKSISFTVKRGGKNNGQYGFYLTESSVIIELADIMKAFKLNSLVDLGCGTGNVIAALNDFFGIYHVRGFEIEQDLIDVAKEYFSQGNIFKKDILTLTKKDIESYQAIYFWEPLYDDELAKKFVKNLEKILSPNQIIIYNRSGRIGDYLESSKKIERMLDINNLHLYRKIEINKILK